jgi:formylglycine-generating enzyme required for sulfatase activity
MLPSKSVRFVIIAALTLLGAAHTRAEEKQPIPPDVKTFTQTIPNSLAKFEMVRVPGGTVEVVIDGKTQTVEVKPLWVAKTETTWNLYDIFAFRMDLTEDEKTAMGTDAKSRPSKPYGAPDWGFGHHNYATLSVTYHAAQKYCEWLSEKTGRKYRLPTEAEWKHACLGGGDGTIDDLDEVAWYEDNADDKTHPVGKKKPNGYGLHDMLGNAGEWAAGLDGTPVLMGGTYLDPEEDVHCGARATQKPSWNQTDPQTPKSTWWLSDGSFVGFRVVCED